MSQQAALFDWLEAVSNPIFVLAERRIVWANTAADALTEYSDLPGKDFNELLAPAWRNGSSGIPQGELELVTASGETRRVNVALRATEHNGEAFTVATVSPLPACQTDTAAVLPEGESRYRALFDQAHAFVTLVDLEGHYLLVNQKFTEAMGYSADEMIGQHITKFIPEQEVSGSLNALEAIYAGKDIPLYQRLFRRRDGTVFPGELDVTLVRDANGAPLYIQSIIRDVTSRVETENALRESEERYRIISELISDYAYAFRVEPNGEIVHEWITDSFKRMTGYLPDEIDAQGKYALYHPDDEARAQAALEIVLKGSPVTDEYRIITKSGELRWVRIFRQPVWDEAQGRVVRMYGVAQDITEQKQSEAELRQSEENYRMIAENVTDMITRTTVDGLRTYVSSVCRTLLGYEPEELLGQHSADIVHPDDMGTIQRAWNAMIKSNDSVTFVCRMRHKNGEYIWFEAVTKPISDPATGEIQEYVAVSRDISTRQQMETMTGEQERLRFELQKEQELNEVKSSLMRTISHEFRTPLALIVTSTDFLDAYLDRLDEERRKERLQAIRVQVKRLSDMLSDISFVVQGTLHHVAARKAMIALKDYCQSILDEIQTTIGKNHQFAYEADDQLAHGIADKALVVRMLTNLLSNAVKYSPENSLITLRLKLDDGDAVLQVVDQGVGIAPDEQKYIFDPFYRSRSVIDQVGGTGLGLSIVKDCVDLHGGTISVESTPGNGTTFTIRLPQTLDEP